MKTDIEIAQSIEMQPIANIAAKLQIPQDALEYYGKYKAKIPLSYLNKEKYTQTPLVLVTAITPTPAGEGKTTTSIGLADALNKLGKRCTVVLREPSLGPVFGIKGGATGGGFAQVVPMEEINLHFTGDFHAVEKAHNLLSALIDNNIQNKENNLGIDPRTVVWKRVVDMNDRALRSVIIGLGGTSQGVPRESGFDITVASEVMAILCMSESIGELKERLGKIYIGKKYDGTAVYARDLKAEGAMTVLLKEAIKPNLVQTLEGTPAIIHGGPFANIAQGTNTILATKMGLSHSDIVVTEAGFASDLGAEKFFDIKMRKAGLKPAAVVLVATIRALKYHGGMKVKELAEPNTEALKKGMVNLEKHVEIIRCFGIDPVIGVNRFLTDSEEEIAVLMEAARKIGVKVALNESWAKGGEGALDLGKNVLENIAGGSASFRFLYDQELEPEEKIEILASRIYGAAKVEYSAAAKQKLKEIKEMGFGKLPICMAKTQKSLSDNPTLKGRPSGFVFTLRDVELAAGAGFIIPIAGTIMRMPGLPEHPAAEKIDIDDQGKITGLF